MFIVTTRQVSNELKSALGHIRLTGIKGHRMRFSGFARMQENWNMRLLVKDKSAMVKALENLQGDISSHFVEKAMQSELRLDISAIKTLDEGYLAYYRAFLLLAREIREIKNFISSHNIDEGSDFYKKTLAPHREEIHSLLQVQLKNLKSLAASARGEAGFAMRVTEMTKSDNEFLNRLTSKRLVKKTFRGVSKVDNLLDKKKLSENDVKLLNDTLYKTLNDMKGLLQMMGLLYRRAVAVLWEDKRVLEQAVKEHELPEKFALVDEGELHKSILGLAEKQIHSLLVILNQLDAYAKRNIQ